MTTPSSRGDLGDEIRRRRKVRSLTQADLAKLAAVATTNVGKLERGDPVSTTTLRAVARALELPAALTDAFLSENADAVTAGEPGADRLTDDERSLTRRLTRRGWSPERIADFLDELRRSNAEQPSVEPRSGTDR